MLKYLPKVDVISAQLRRRFMHASMQLSDSCMKFLILCLTTILFCANTLAEKTVYTYLGPGPAEGYDRQLLRLAFEKTRAEYGPFEIHHSPAMSEARAKKSILDGAYAHPIRSDASHPSIQKDPHLTYVEFPIYFGILGYRVCFVSPDTEKKLEKLSAGDSLKSFIHGQGRGWRDIHILRDNGFKVVVAPTADNLYRMVAANRVDFFCRGTNEVLNEVALYKDVKNVLLDQEIAFFYPFPFFFYTNSSDTETLERIEKGILAAYQDGSMQALWKVHFDESVRFSKLDKRKIFHLENRYTRGIPFSYEQYLYQPADPRF